MSRVSDGRVYAGVWTNANSVTSNRLEFEGTWDGGFNRQVGDVINLNRRLIVSVNGHVTDCAGADVPVGDTLDGEFDLNAVGLHVLNSISATFGRVDGTSALDNLAQCSLPGSNLGGIQ